MSAEDRVILGRLLQARLRDTSFLLLHVICSNPVIKVRLKKNNSDSHLSGPVYGAVNTSKKRALSPGSSEAFDQRNDIF